MTINENKFFEIGDSLKGAQKSQMFGKPCYKINGKAFMSFFSGCMVFKLGGISHTEAMKLNDSVLFDPSGKGRPMKEWVQVSAANQDKWPVLAEDAMDYVKSMNSMD